MLIKIIGYENDEVSACTKYTLCTDQYTLCTE